MLKFSCSTHNFARCTCTNSENKQASFPSESACTVHLWQPRISTCFHSLLYLQKLNGVTCQKWKKGWSTTSNSMQTWRFFNVNLLTSAIVSYVFNSFLFFRKPPYNSYTSRPSSEKKTPVPTTFTREENTHPHKQEEGLLMKMNSRKAACKAYRWKCTSQVLVVPTLIQKMNEYSSIETKSSVSGSTFSLGETIL